MMKGIIEARQLSTGYGKKIVLKDQNIVIPKNKITVILGPNGCGKSTMLKTMARVLPLKDGKIILKKCSESFKVIKKKIKNLDYSFFGASIPGIELAQINHEILEFRLFMS